MAEDFGIGDEALAAATERGRLELDTKPRAVSAHYDQKTGRIVIELASGCTLLFPPSLVQDLQDATTDQLVDIEVSPFGLALHWPQLDVDFSVGGLVAGVVGTAKSLDEQRCGGQSRSAADAAGRENGRQDGQPRRSA